MQGYYGGNNNPKAYITQDTSDIQRKVNNQFHQADMKWNYGKTIEEKEQGITLQIQGIKMMKLWIDRENEEQKKGLLLNLYNQKYAECQTRMEKLKEDKKTQNKPVMMVDDKQPGQNNEKDKLRQALEETVVAKKPNVKWEDIAGLHAAKTALKEAVTLPIKYPQIFTGSRKPWKGILLYGPPGTGKTFIAKACATELEGTFYTVSASNLISKFVGESERLIKTLFQMARENKPAIIFIDEIDSMASARSENEQESSRRVKTEFLVQMDGVGSEDQGILVLGATNYPFDLDPAIRRRFQKRIYIPLPDEEARFFLIKHKLNQDKHEVPEPEIKKVAQMLDGYSGSDITTIISEASMIPFRRFTECTKLRKVMIKNEEKLIAADDNATGPDIVPKSYQDGREKQVDIGAITANDLYEAIKRQKPSVSKEQLKQYEEFTSKFGQEG